MMRSVVVSVAAAWTAALPFAPVYRSPSVQYAPIEPLPLDNVPLAGPAIALLRQPTGVQPAAPAAAPTAQPAAQSGFVVALCVLGALSGYGLAQVQAPLPRFSSRS